VEILAGLAKEAESAGAKLETLRLDVTSAESIAAAKAEIDARTDGAGVDVLVNNAGYGIAVPVDEITDADLRAQYETNVFGLVAMVRAFVPAMRARGRGRIINVSSIGGRVTFPLLGAYNSTKYAVESLSDAMRSELKPFGIDVVLVEPGAIRTNFASRSVDVADAYHGRADSPYAPAYARYKQLARKADELAPGPDVIARAIERAATARWPRARYVAPFINRFLVAFAKALPTRLFDWVVRQMLGLTPRKLGLGTPAASARALNAPHVTTPERRAVAQVRS
jgi:NAD(P)-dependent dehydrogenase (short-subunit alcohol dehydrogenase family)